MDKMEVKNMKSNIARCIQQGTMYGAGASFWLFIILKVAIVMG